MTIYVIHGETYEATVTGELSTEAANAFIQAIADWAAGQSLSHQVSPDPAVRAQCLAPRPISIAP